MKMFLPFYSEKEVYDVNPSGKKNFKSATHG